MSQTVATQDLVSPSVPATSPERFRPLALAVSRDGRQARSTDPLLRGSESAFADVLRQRLETPAAPPRQDGARFSLGLDTTARELKQKTFSLLAHLGVLESGQTHSLRRPISTETRQAVLDPAAHAPAATVVAAAAQAPVLTEGDAELTPQELPTAAVAATQAAPLASAEQPAAPVQAVAEDQRYPAPTLADGSHALRMPVSTALRQSLAIDLVAEQRARALLTAQAKASLLPVTGELSAVFESGKDGISAVGYDRRGGTSYGKYQIASRVGSMGLFLNFLNEHEPDWAQRLRKAGPANTRSRWGGMPSEWKKIAAENPKRFEELQDAFILATNYQPAVDGIMAKANIDVAALSPALQEVLWSTAVQHGPNGASNIFTKAAQVAQGKKSQNFDKVLIEEVYRTRKGSFSGSSRQIRAAVHNRLNQEKNLALQLLDEGA